jgi:hypothetical protein
MLIPLRARNARTSDDEATLLMMQPITLLVADIMKLSMPIDVAFNESKK